jgi:hypothetical protein
MNDRRSFGRRDMDDQASRTIKVVRKSTKAYSSERYVEQRALLLEKSEFATVDEDLREWKRARKPNFDVLWRPLLLIATLSFGIASFVLPDSVNDTVDWLLYTMMGVSLYSWIRGRFRSANT